MYRLLALFLLLFAIACKEDSGNYWINFDGGENSIFTTPDMHGISFLIEDCDWQSSLQSLNDTLKLKQYLSESEMKNAFDSYSEITGIDTSYYYMTRVVPWDTLIVKDNYTAELILISDETDNRGYYFQIRTYDKNRAIISIQDFATWADKYKKYCSGYFVKSDQTFTVTCEDNTTEYKIDEYGKIDVMD